MKRYSHIIFDVDGTLQDTEHAVIWAYHELARFYDVGEFSDEFVRRNCFISPPPEACRRLGMREDAIEGACDFLNRLVYGRDDVRLFPGVQEMLDMLREKGILMAVCTARTPEEFPHDHIFATIAHYFTEIMHSEYAARPKPAPDAVLAYLAKYSLAKEDVLFVGDSQNDYLCARSAGLDFALAGWAECADRTLTADYVPETPVEILGLV